MHNQNIIQLNNAIGIIVNDGEFKKVEKQFKSIFSFRRFITVRDIRGHKITIRKKDIILLEQCK